MITLWRKYFTSASSTSHNYANNKGVAGASTADFDFPFVYVELCTEYGAKVTSTSLLSTATSRLSTSLLSDFDFPFVYFPFV